jgi:quercetin dioxygenase-like cupin family protein
LLKRQDYPDPTRRLAALAAGTVLMAVRSLVSAGESNLWRGLMIKQLVLCTAVVAVCVGASMVWAQEPVKATVLQRVDLPDGKLSTILLLVEVQPHSGSPRHMHPGIEVGYVLEGEIEFKIGDQEPKLFKQGDTFTIPLNAIHVGKAGPNGTKLLNTFVVEKDKPLAVPFP